MQTEFWVPEFIRNIIGQYELMEKQLIVGIVMKAN